MDGQHWMASAMRAARSQLEIAAHNLANVSTDGFRRALGTTRLGAGGLDVTRRTVRDQGAVHQTGRRFDLALLGEGAFRVGAGTTRDGAFTRDRDGHLVDDRGHRLRGERGDVSVSENATVASDGAICDGGRVVDRLPLPPGTRVMAGALESSAVNAIGETLAILTAQRAFETAEKTLSAIDAARQKAANDVARVQ
ncbi:MAG TPA: flagellar basal body rod C-terminal domain-containing protein [Candidatus Elarobacter sp.]|jgi:flagellar basal-body rod protein FlgG|nr:flagellar basal body rod C-terminal domain-containing protein [Candidatus Elarobacter sp.]